MAFALLDISGQSIIMVLAMCFSLDGLLPPCASAATVSTAVADIPTVCLEGVSSDPFGAKR